MRARPTTARRTARPRSGRLPTCTARVLHVLADTLATLVIFGFFARTVHIPAVIVLGFWIVLQLLNGYLTFSAQTLGRGESGGVAWFAHIGGFLAGMVLLFLMRPRQSVRL